MLAHPDGRMEVGGLNSKTLPREQAVLSVSVPGYLPVKGIHAGDLPFADGLARLDLRLDPGRRLEGTVQDADGRLVEGARVFAWPAELGAKKAPSETECQMGLTDASGRFVLQGLPPGQPLTLWARGDADASNLAMEHPLEIAPGSEVPVSLKLDAVGEVSGRVLDAQGKPLAGISVAGEFEGNGVLYVLRWADSDAEGRYTLKGLPHWGGLRVLATAKAGVVEWGMRGWSDVPVGASGLDIAIHDIDPRKPRLDDIRPYGR